jgi:hypothetical protein
MLRNEAEGKRWATEKTTTSTRAEKLETAERGMKATKNDNSSVRKG